MATTTNYGWTTPDDTALVKDGAAAIRSLGSSVDTTVKNLNPETTLGDISYRSSTANTNTRLAIGTTGQVLTVSGGVPAWATPTATGKSWTLLNSGGTSLTGAGTITISGISGKEDLLVIIIDASSDSASSFIRVRPNGINASYVVGGASFIWGSTYSVTNYSGTGSAGANGINLGQLSSNASSRLNGSAVISGCSGTGNKQFTAAGQASDGGGNSATGAVINGFIPASAAITSIDIVSSVGNFDNGTVYVYGA